jgi:hypothetical protein
MPDNFVEECSARGDRTQEVQKYRDFFTADDDEVLAYLNEIGAWEEEELQDRKTNFDRLLWMMACGINEFGEFYYSD